MKDHEQLNIPLGVPSKPIYRPSKRFYTFIPDPYWKELALNPSQDKHENSIFDRETSTPGANSSFPDLEALTPDPSFSPVDLVRNTCPIAPQHKDLVGEQPFLDTAPQEIESDRWNLADFGGEIPRKLDANGQLSIFYDHSEEPPDPDDYQTLNDYHRAWADWRTRVGEQVSNATFIDSAKSRVGEQVPNGTLINSVESRIGEQVTQTTKNFAPQHDVTHWVEKYWVERAGNKYWYYRYMWMSGRKINRVYIGSARSPQAQRKKQAVEDAIADGQLPLEIKQMLKDR